MSLDIANLDNVVAVPGTALDEITLVDVLQQALALVGKVAAEDAGRSPLTVRLTDAHDRCLVSITMTFEQGRWKSRIEDGEIESRDGMAFPWFVVLEGSTGRARRIRVELESQAESS